MTLGWREARRPTGNARNWRQTVSQSPKEADQMDPLFLDTVVIGGGVVGLIVLIVVIVLVLRIL
jgi:hypothetical protein